jgi:hypothetical protein
LSGSKEIRTLEISQQPFVDRAGAGTHQREMRHIVVDADVLSPGTNARADALDVRFDLIGLRISLEACGHLHVIRVDPVERVAREERAEDAGECDQSQHDDAGERSAVADETPSGLGPEGTSGNWARHGFDRKNGAFSHGRSHS